MPWPVEGWTMDLISKIYSLSFERHIFIIVATLKKKKVAAELLEIYGRRKSMMPQSQLGLYDWFLPHATTASVSQQEGRFYYPRP